MASGKILVVDDSEPARSAIGASLGRPWQGAANAHEARIWLQAEPFGAVVVDVCIPGSCADLVGHIRLSYPSLPVAVVSVVSGESSEREIARLVAAGWRAVGIDLADFGRAVRKIGPGLQPIVHILGMEVPEDMVDDLASTSMSMRHGAELRAQASDRLKRASVEIDGLIDIDGG